MNPPGWLVDRLPEWARSIRFRSTIALNTLPTACLHECTEHPACFPGQQGIAGLLGSFPQRPGLACGEQQRSGVQHHDVLLGPGAATTEQPLQSHLWARLKRI